MTPNPKSIRSQVDGSGTAGSVGGGLIGGPDGGPSGGRTGGPDGGPITGGVKISSPPGFGTMPPTGVELATVTTGGSVNT